MFNSSHKLRKINYIDSIILCGYPIMKTSESCSENLLICLTQNKVKKEKENHLLRYLSIFSNKIIKIDTHFDTNSVVFNNLQSADPKQSLSRKLSRMFCQLYVPRNCMSPIIRLAWNLEWKI